MSKMNAPKMEVVRFKEADVIVASGVPTGGVRISNFYDGIGRNGTAEFNGKTYTFDNTLIGINFANDVNSYYGTTQYLEFWVEGASLGSVYSLPYNEAAKDTGVNVDINGIWEYDAALHNNKGGFKRQ